MNEQLDVFDVMRTARTFRRFRDEPVSDELLGRCLEAATWAPSGGNQQPWRFVVLRSPACRKVLAVGAGRAIETIQRVYGMRRPEPGDVSPRARNARAVFDLHDGAADVPAAVLFCTRSVPNTPALFQGSAVYPAMQNFLLAGRALGLGACVTGWHVDAEAEWREVVGIPDEWELAALVVVGWPRGSHGPVRRRPVQEAACVDRWDAPFEPELDGSVE